MSSVRQFGAVADDFDDYLPLWYVRADDEWAQEWERRYRASSSPGAVPVVTVLVCLVCVAVAAVWNAPLSAGDVLGLGLGGLLSWRGLRHDWG